MKLFKSTLRLLLISSLAAFAFPLSAQRMLNERTTSSFDTGVDSTKTVDVPRGIHAWRVDPRFGEVVPARLDTFPERFQRTVFTSDTTSAYNHTGAYGSPRESRLFALRLNSMYNDGFLFARPYDFFLPSIGDFLFTNTKAPYTNITYHSNGNKQNGDDRITALFAVNAGKKLGFGFKLDYLYSRGYYDSQSAAHFDGTLFGSYHSDKYNAHLIYTANHLKNSENGGIENDDYVKRPESFPTSYGTADIPVLLDRTWNKLNVNTLFLSHRYSLGFYRDSTFAETSADTTRSLFQPVSSFIHTLRIDHDNRRFLSNDRFNASSAGYFADFYLPGDSANDFTRRLAIENTFAIALNEGFNRISSRLGGMRLYARHRFSRHTLPAIERTKASYTENHITIGAQLLKSQGSLFHYNVLGEISTTGHTWGDFNAEGKARLSLPLRKDSLLFTLSGHIRGEQPSFYYTHYHARNAWWDLSLDRQISARVDATLAYRHSRLTATIQSIQNYTYFAEHLTPYKNTEGVTLNSHGISVEQSAKNLQLLGVTLRQEFKFGVLHWENELSYQASSSKEVFPLPAFQAYTNLYLLFRIAKVLRTEFGADLTYFTRYKAPVYSPIIGNYANQDTAQPRVEIGGHPFVNVYANFHLKNTRFYVMASHVNYKPGAGNPFLVPHYPTNRMLIRIGISWNFFN